MQEFANFQSLYRFYWKRDLRDASMLFVKSLQNACVMFQIKRSLLNVIKSSSNTIQRLTSTTLSGVHYSYTT